MNSVTFVTFKIKFYFKYYKTKNSSLIIKKQSDFQR